MMRCLQPNANDSRLERLPPPPSYSEGYSDPAFLTGSFFVFWVVSCSVMILLPEIDPVAFRIGMFPVRWYGLTYLAGFAAFWWLGRVRAARTGSGWKGSEIEDLLFFGAIGVIVGGRLGYVLFYDLAHTVSNPWNLFQIWKGGMSFHGGLLGVLAAMWVFARSSGRSVFQVTDFIIPMIPPGLGFGRVGNFINGELWGKVGDVPWAMVFPGGGPLARHPSQLYQALLEGLVLFLILWFFSRKPRPTMSVSGLFLVVYGVFRFFIEFVRVPDSHLNYLAFDWLTMGQVLSLPMVVVGAGLLTWSYRSQRSAQVEIPMADPPAARRKQRRRARPAR